MRCSTVILAASAVLASPSAQARDLVVLQACTDDALSVYAAQLARQVAPDGSARVLPDAPDCNAVERFRGRLKAGRTAFEALELDTATKLLKALLADMQAAAHFEGDTAIRLEAQLYLAWIGLEQRDNATAKRYFEATCTDDPSWVPNSMQFPPNVTQQLARTCKQLKPAPKLDDAKRDDSTKLRAAIAAKELRLLRPIFRSTGADTVVIIDVLDSGTLAAASQRPFDKMAGPLQLTMDPVVDAVRVQHLFEPPPTVVTSTPVYKRWWFWTGLGVVATAATVTIIVATHDDKTFRVQTQLP